MRLYMIIMMFVCVIILSSCSMGEMDDVSEKECSITVYGFNGDDMSELEKNADANPIFSDSDIDFVDWSNYRIYFTDEFLSRFDVQGIIENYDEFGLDGLRIYAVVPWDRYAFLVNDELIFTGEFPVGLISSYAPMGNVMIDEVDGVRFVVQPEDDLKNDERILEAIDKLGLTKE